MEFCPECKFMVYTVLDKTDGPDSEKYVLRNYCKNCGWKDNAEIKPNNSVYSRNYENEFLADKMLTNKYTIFDNSLPRLSYDCINDKCITNQKLETNKCFIVSNIPEDYDDVAIRSLFTNLSFSIKNIIRVKLTSIVLEIEEELTEEKKSKLFSDISVIQNEGITDNLEVTNFKVPDKEVIYMKYNPDDMKYIYMCVNCGTSWQGSTDKFSFITSRKG